MFDRSKIIKVYSGRKGCACGCKGKYTYSSAFRDERPDYYEGEDGVSDAVVKRIANTVERLLREGQDISCVMVAADWIAVDLHHDKTYTIYFK